MSLWASEPQCGQRSDALRTAAGTAPTRHRFTCGVEARWRSRALNTTHHAETLARNVAAVPGSVHSANSAGCHRLLKDGGAVLVTDAAELTELLAS